MIKTLSLAGVTVPKTAALAPMASVADRAYRTMCKRYGASYVVGEMASAKGLCYSDRKTAELLYCSAEEGPMAVQLFGSEPEFMAKACKIAAAYHPQWIDINMGCPVSKVVSTGSGSALMRTPALAFAIVAACADAVDIPITVKIRSGFDAANRNAVEMAKGLEKAGASVIAVHGRTKQQMYAPPADWEIIKQVKEAVSIPVIGNGDVTDPLSAKALYEQTGCDLIMIGRGSYGRPWIFEEVRHFFEHGTLLPPRTPEERMEVLLEQVSLACSFKPPRVAMREARKLAIWYVKGLRQAAHFRGACSQLTDYEDLKRLTKQIVEAQREEAPIEEAPIEEAFTDQPASEA